MALEPGVLKAAILWARNHIEVGIEPDMKDAIIQRLDDVLSNHHPTGDDMQMLRDFYPVHNPALES